MKLKDIKNLFIVRKAVEFYPFLITSAGMAVVSIVGIGIGLLLGSLI